MEELVVTLFGIHSPSLHSGLIEDSLRGTIDCRIEIEDDAARGLVVTAPASYWHRAPLLHPLIGLDCIRARIRKKKRPHATMTDTRAEIGIEFETESPNRTATPGASSSSGPLAPPAGRVLAAGSTGV
jgi:hypothetical protein